MEKIWSQISKFFQELIDFAKEHVSTQVLIYIAAAVAVLVVVWLISRSIKKRKTVHRMEELEAEVNEIRNNSLQYKYNKASAFARVNDDIVDRLHNLAPKYEVCQKSLSHCEALMDETQERVSHRRYGKAMKTMDELETMLDDTEERIRIVNSSLDHILAKETEVRNKSNALKERFRNVKSIYQNNRANFYSGCGYVDSFIEEVEGMFNTFEEWMFASNFIKAKDEIDKISARTDELSEIVSQTPDLYSKAKLLLPQALNEVEIQKQEIAEDKVDISYLNVEQKTEAIQNALADALVKLDNGNLKAASYALDAISDQILALQEDISKERKAFDEIHGDLESNFAIVDEVEGELNEIISLYANIKDRFGLEDWTKRFKKAQEQMDDLKEQRAVIQDELAKEDTLQADVVHNYRDFAERTIAFGRQVREMKQMLVGATSDEYRARKQVVKLQLILNEVRLNTMNKQLPSVSDQFAQDLQEGENKIKSVKNILSHSPLDVQALNGQLQDTIDFVYKLYNNANNLAGVAVMVENAIVFGNRFRSSYPALDSELTRAEFCFQNGEYTRALKIAIQAIENLHPGVYEKLIARKDPAVMNVAQ